MQSISIQPSAIARLGFAGIVSSASVLWAFFTTDLLLWAGMQLLVLILAHWIWNTTVGLARPLELFYRGKWYLEAAGSAPQELLSVRTGFVSPNLVTAELRGAAGVVRIVVPYDGLPPAEHWQLRRLLIQGVNVENENR